MNKDLLAQTIMAKCDRTNLGLVIGGSYDIYRVDGTTGNVEQLIIYIDTCQVPIL